MPKKAKLNNIVKYAVKGLPKAKSKQLSVFIRDYFRDVAYEELDERSTQNLAYLARSHFELALSWKSGLRKIRIFNPDKNRDGWESKYTIVQVVTTNMPFLVDSIMMEINRQGYTINFTIHPLIHLQRDATGKFENIYPVTTNLDSALLEPYICIEIDKESDPDKLKQLTSSINRILVDNRLACKDWQPLTRKVVEIIDSLENSPPPVRPRELKRSISFLHWLLDNNFIFLGYRNYNLITLKQGDSLRIVPASGRGILRARGKEKISRSFDILPEKIKKNALSSNLLTITKSNSRSTVHRPVYLDYIGIKRFNKRGKVIGEHRILGLYTSSAYMANPQTVPLLKDKMDRVMKQSKLVPDSHAGKALMNILQTYPRDELFQTDTGQLLETTMGILNLQERQRVRLFARRDPFERFIACIIFIPKEQYQSGIRERIQQILQKAFNGTSVDFSTSIAESVYAQLYLIIHTRPGLVPKYDLKLVEEDVTAATRSWVDELHRVLLSNFGKEQGSTYFQRYGNAYPASYMEEQSVEEALIDNRFIDLALETKQITLNLYRNIENDNRHLVLKLFSPDSAMPLSTIIPILENMGLFIESERPYEIQPRGARVVWAHNFGMYYNGHDISDFSKVRDFFRDALTQVWTGKLENDGLNKLVFCAGLKPREIMLLRAYARYFRQLGTSFSEEYIQDTLINNSHITKLLITLFETRFDPGLKQDKRNASKQLQRNIKLELDAVSSLDEDRILRRFFDLIQATLRTNFFQLDEHAQTKEYISFKVSPELIPDIPNPRPKYEIFVYSPRVEGIHLRGGKVARGGLRWSDRRDDFRTEVLGLMKAQMVKNAVIVPVGAKGGFYVKRPPVNDRQALQNEGIECYKILIRGLLDITDNRIGNKIISPANVIRYDDDDPYLVVAADKGTAAFSDIANALSADYKFWLGDAFASGGSEGYDHKKMAITARGAWESVKYNFQALAVDIQNTDFTVVGIGDMAGDVFGNGMLLSPHIKLVAAFNHMHIFIDPNPDPVTSLGERRRLFELPRSSWADYNNDIISTGGGIYSRTSKSIKLTPELKTLLHVDIDKTSPDELIRLLLMAPVDLLWNGGIGTYVKADKELNMDVGDKANDALRINSSQLACKVVGEGGNLGFTQRARITFAEKHGRINADWIDNSGGVDCSDREVNIKILLNKLLTDGIISLQQRNKLLHKMTDNVAEMVLQDNYRQVRAIDVMQIESAIRPGWYALLINALEKNDGFSRKLEYIPDQATIEKRMARQRGFSHPEIAALLAHTKTAVYNELVESSLLDDAYLAGILLRYFPVQLQKKYSEAIKEHRLHHEIIATVLTNSVVNRAGITFAHRLADETGASLAVVCKAFLVARDVFDIHGLWMEIDKLDHIISTQSQAELVFETQHLLRHATRWFIRNEKYLDEVTNTVEYFSTGIRPLKLLLRKVLTGTVRKNINEKIRAYRDEGIPARIASRFASLRVILSSLDMNQLALQRKVDINLIIKLFFLIDSTLKIHSLRYNADTLTTDNVWQDIARVNFIQELNQLQTELTKNALKHYKAGDDVAKVVDLWLANNINAHKQYRDACKKMKFARTNELAVLSVMLGKLRKFV